MSSSVRCLLRWLLIVRVHLRSLRRLPRFNPRDPSRKYPVLPGLSTSGELQYCTLDSVLSTRPRQDRLPLLRGRHLVHEGLIDECTSGLVLPQCLTNRVTKCLLSKSPDRNVTEKHLENLLRCSLGVCSYHTKRRRRIFRLSFIAPPLLHSKSDEKLFIMKKKKPDNHG